MQPFSNDLFAKRTLRSAAVVILAGAVLGGGLSAFAVNGADLGKRGGAARNDGDQTSSIKAALKGGKAKNVILFIGDGMGDSEITSARDYQYGAAGRLPGIDALPLTGQYTTYSLKKGTTQPDYVPDSAATGSAWATGTKTYDNAVSVNTYGAPQKTLLELAKAKGLKTGDVTTSEIQDATPAVQVSHISARSCYGPVATSTTCPTEALENGGLGSITEQLINTRPDVTFGGGSTTFNEVA
ncbi:MAG: phoA, partial [Nocardioidaceae bacterium]|nr:phoA [Nocardioidaceae bacterium]